MAAQNHLLEFHCRNFALRYRHGDCYRLPLPAENLSPILTFKQNIRIDIGSYIRLGWKGLEKLNALEEDTQCSLNASRLSMASAMEFSATRRLCLYEPNELSRQTKYSPKAALAAESVSGHSGYCWIRQLRISEAGSVLVGVISQQTDEHPLVRTQFQAALDRLL